jgi:tetratricopeptide (TPR) repeat protein
MIGRIWQPLVRLFQQILTGFRGSSNRPALEPRRDLHPPSDAELEHYFLQLLDGIDKGWQQVKVRRFFEAFRDRVTDERWSDWLRQFGAKLQESPDAHPELARRLQRLGELGYGEISTVARQIATQLGSTEAPLESLSPLPTATPAMDPEVENPVNNGVQTVPQTQIDEKPTLGQELISQEPANPTVILSGTTHAESVTDSTDLETANFLAVSPPSPQVVAPISEANPPVQIQTLNEPLDVEGWFTRGVERLEAGDDRAALNAFNRVIELEPNHSRAWRNRGNTLFNLEQGEDALAAYDRAIEIRPDDGLSWAGRGDALYDLERIEEALTSWNTALEYNPNEPEIWYSKGLALGVKLGQWEEALQSLDQAIALNSSDVQFWFYRGIALSSLNQLEEALVSWDKVLEIQPNFRDAWINKGVVLQKLGRYSEAIEANNQAIGLLSH